jgi:hypothetical protein
LNILLPQLQQLQTTVTGLSSPLTTLLSQVESVGAKLDSLTKRVESLETPKTPPTSSHPQTDGRWVVTIDGPFGLFKTEAVAVECRDRSSMVILYDPASPHFVPAQSDESLVVRAERGGEQLAVRVRPVGWSTLFAWQGKDYLLMILPVVDDLA